MPVYEYRCGECGKKFQIVATIAEYDAGLKAACPQCRSPRVGRIISRPTVLGTTRKGSGEESFDDLDSGENLEGGDEDEGSSAGLDDEE